AHECLRIRSAEPPELSEDDIRKLVGALRETVGSGGDGNGTNGIRPSGSELGLGRPL
ncbi:MAG: hypothetical protein GWN99_04240, partial [Gemmatimonadetes bacterium]|nr:hypothetical protein [Gemmatimonadota bacterium]NIS00275.1 hypothetical protein [Gemmatimonadota bacterium]NIT65887.1 hypothetical protein [Gemmatimonadota bacterium]NIV22514.1 hypothetical protein [Gemmatimonadota bacterium]NIW35282.1 hypothetical protein [Gemmatimonadota bacterium]